ncbi:MAG: hypothetical protein OQJ76_10160 [Rhodospirillales bacterium]|nr:hypothetical protein [Rhodospirillales bacterium]
MRRTNRVQRPLSCGPSHPFVHPFANAEEAWLWYVACQRARADGARVRANLSEKPRPCDPDDIYRAVMALRKAGRLGAHHIRVLGAAIRRDRRPDPRVAEEAKAAHLWEQAMAALGEVLAAKGIVK